MKTSISGFRTFSIRLFQFCLLGLFFTATESQAQNKPAPACAKKVVGVVDNNVMVWSKKTSKNQAELKELTKCLQNTIDKPIICYDGSGNIITAPANDTPANRTKDDTKPLFDFRLLAGETNCKLMNVMDKVMMPNGESVTIGTTCKCTKTPDCKCAGQKGCDCDCSCQSQERWDFVAVDDNDDSKGFYIMTREDKPRAIIRSGEQVFLRTFGSMDGKMRQQAQWNIFISGRRADGSTKYLLRPQGDWEHILLPDAKGTLFVKPHNFDWSETASRTNIPPASKPELQVDWKCECLF